MQYDRDKVADMVLALMYLNLFDMDEYGARAWKSFPWEATDRLFERSDIGDPRGKAKSVVLSKEAYERAEELFKRYFGVDDAPGR